MARLRHFAVCVKDLDKAAEFYANVFDLKRIGREDLDIGSAIYMSDGYLTLAILRNRGEATPSGINHFGFQVEDLKDVEKKLAKWEEPLAERPSTRPFASVGTCTGLPPR